MNKYQSIHETPIRAALDVLDLIKNTDADDVFNKAKRSPYASTSIARIASNMTLVFPVMCSTNLHIDTDMMIMKAIERKCAVMLQILFSAYQITDVDDAQEFINQFHSNIRLSGKASVDDFIALGDALSESTSITVDKSQLAKLSKDFRENCYFTFEDDIAPTSIEENYRGVVTEKVYGKDPSGFHDHSGYDNDRNAMHFAPSGKGKTTTSQNTVPSASELSMNSQGQGDLVASSSQKAHSNRDASNMKKYADDKDASDINLNYANYFKNQILTSDVKKANELVPTTMVVNFTRVDPKSGRAVPVENVVIGIKARMIPVDSEDIITHILTKLEDKNYLIQLIRATTREISFFKDFIFAVDNAKLEALARSKRGSSNPMWKVLERRAIMSRMKRFVGIKGNNANAITTLVVSQEEIDYVRKNFNKNFDSMKVIGTLFDAYNLMGFVIADESLEVAKFCFDTGEDMFETLAFSTLEREASDNSYKKIVNLMSKIS